MSEETAQAGFGRDRQSAIYGAGVSGRRPRVPTDHRELERRARRACSPRAWAYVAGGAGAEATMRANRAAFDRRSIVPRTLRDVSRRDLGVELFGRRIPAPVLFAPVGAVELVHPEADLAVARAAAELGLPYVFSNQACVPMEDCAATMGDAPRWFQLYWSTDEELVDSLLARAERSGAEAVVVTLDTTMLGWRPRDLDLGSLPFARGEGIAQYTSDPRFREMVRERVARGSGGEDVRITFAAVRALLSMSRRFPGPLLRNLRSPEPREAVRTFLDTYSRPSLTWADLASLRERTKLPIVLKGVLHPDDARRAVDAGVDGVVVSNHGGRQVDGSVAALDALAEIAPVVGAELTVLFDSGIRSGGDVVKALALGADAVCVGRPYVHGLGLAGAAGDPDAVADVVAELDLTLGLTGHASPAELTPNVLRG
ncbi:MULTISPECIES: alpha-hydroxy-acid oxidizing protein [unclassified Saccharopolyspora]|uniref:alpha-hydroxy-acid oxidizing protein n=1 Tax=unclassified Saccharopolyspora TaxID=2646250 RepID=UPI001CD4FD89|nr:MULTISPECIES: alpha-hydroxy-acid oxidizing protein [unclassified Saccharopolyspora]MCA1187373.1 alpha-hydroxy-acid oxidizing protein [Saccharopolyspora sp. 6T]MCA1194262.1 alpha-hydroxy-acid oxidizing protein [Saccharopolyspora sp. 6V]MCA1224775.1 alpha-hydroxy-acid oxidizing protein [Saccharopolyspora sp. 6M]